MEEIFLTLECKKNAGERRVAVIGDVILDEYVTGTLRALEYPVFLPEKRFMYLGGAGNVALNIKEMWDKPFLFSVLGEDEKSSCFRSILNAKGLDAACLNVERPRNICHKTRIVADSKILIRMDNDDTRAIGSSAENQLYNKLKYNIDDIKVVVVSDYHKGCISEALLKKIKVLCGLKKVKILYDTKKMCSFQDSFLLKMKIDDFESVADGEDTGGLSDKIVDFKHRHHIQNILVTMGEKGADFVDENDHCTHLSAVCNEAVSTCGAGDTMMAAIAVCLANEIDIHSAVTFANYAAAAACQHEKTYAVSLDDVKELWHTSCL